MSRVGSMNLVHCVRGCFCVLISIRARGCPLVDGPLWEVPLYSQSNLSATLLCCLLLWQPLPSSSTNPSKLPTFLHIYTHTALPNELPSSITGSDCECPQNPNGNITRVLLGIFLVAVIGLFIVGSVLLGLCVHNMRKKQPLRSLTDSPYFHESGSIKGDTLTRSISRASYNSDTSRSSGRSSKSHTSERSSKSTQSR